MIDREALMAKLMHDLDTLIPDFGQLSRSDVVALLASAYLQGNADLLQMLGEEPMGVALVADGDERTTLQQEFQSMSDEVLKRA